MRERPSAGERNYNIFLDVIYHEQSQAGVAESYGISRQRVNQLVLTMARRISSETILTRKTLKSILGGYKKMRTCKQEWRDATEVALDLFNYKQKMNNL